MQAKHYGLIMAGGVGSRFWPMSRQSLPKQFLDVLSTGQTLLQMTYKRLCQFLLPENIFVVTNVEYKDLLHSQLPELKDYQVLFEPVGRNTAPCIAYGVFKIHQRCPDASVLVCPSDHLITDEPTFQRLVLEALNAASLQPYLFTLGIRPTRPDTGYGYIQFEEDELATSYYKVKSFTEKPNREIAEIFVASGEYLWNSGIFIASSNHFIKEFKKYLPDVYDLFHDIRAVYYSQEEGAAIADAYKKSPNISIDYGMMEKADSVYVLPAAFGWSDLGTWASLYEHIPHDKNHNAIKGKTILYNAQSNLIHSQHVEKIIVLKDIQEMIIVDTKDVLLVCPKSQEQFVKDIVQTLKKDKNYERYI